MTRLSPLEEHLFQAWARAHGVQDQDHPNNSFDYRGLYKQGNGQLLPPHMVRQVAADHNAAANQKGDGGSVELPDPYMAQAEMHKANLDAHSKSQSDAQKLMLEREKMKHKLMIEHMKLQHKSVESEKDRQHKAIADQRSAQMSMAQHQMDRHAAIEDAHMNRQHQIEDAQTQRAQQVQDAQMQHQHSIEDQARGHQMNMQRESMKPVTKGQPTQGPHPMGGSPLEHVMMQRMMQ